MRVVIVGGCGYIGFHIRASLESKGHEVTLFDVRPPDPEWEVGPTPYKFMEGSILDLDRLKEVLKASEADSVIHCASYGMSGKQQLTSEYDLTERINITGTKNVIEASVASGVRYLVYTSTYNVVFGGREIRDGSEETIPYFPLHKHVDHYSRTKAIAEQLVLVADGKWGLRTSALRLAGVMGLKEKRHMPRIVDSLSVLCFRYGNATVDFVSLENAVQAHVKVVERFGGTEDGPSILGGQAYFISDGKPVDNFEYFRPLIEGLGYTFPWILLPVWFVFAVAFFLQFASKLVKIVNPNFVPYLCPAEVYKTGITHYFRIDKARKDFGYEPIKPNDLTEVVEYFKKLGKVKKNRKYL